MAYPIVWRPTREEFCSVRRNRQRWDTRSKHNNAVYGLVLSTFETVILTPFFVLHSKILIILNCIWQVEAQRKESIFQSGIACSMTPCTTLVRMYITS